MAGGADIKKISDPTLENFSSYQDPRDLDLPLFQKSQVAPLDPRDLVFTLLFLPTFPVTGDTNGTTISIFW